MHACHALSSQWVWWSFLLSTFQCTPYHFVDLIEILLQSSQKDKENRTVDERFQDFKLIVKFIVEDLGMPINIKGGFHWVSRYYFPHDHLLEWAKRRGSWMPFTVFLEYYFQELKKGSEFLVAGFDRSIFHLGNHLNDADLPLHIYKLIPNWFPGCH